jgi:hypothetical protein
VPLLLLLRLVPVADEYLDSSWLISEMESESLGGSLSLSDELTTGFLEGLLEGFGAMLANARV